MVEVKVFGVHGLFPWNQEQRIAFYINQGYEFKGVSGGYAYFTRTQSE